MTRDITNYEYKYQGFTIIRDYTKDCFLTQNLSFKTMWEAIEYLDELVHGS